VRLARLVPFLFLAAVAAVLAARWASIPERFPVHWGLDGVPDRWVGRDAISIFGPLAGGAALAALLLRRPVRALAGRHGRGPHGIRAGEGALLGACYALAAASGAMAARPLMSGDSAWVVLVGAGLGMLFVPLLVGLSLARRR
jgi:hypothetical protein